MPHRYRHSGVTIDSEIALPEWKEFVDDGTGTADVSIELAGKIDAVTPDLRFERGILTIDIPDAGRFVVDEGKTVRYFPLPDTGDAERRLFLLGSAWSAVGYQRGWAMMHGSAVRIGSRAVLICGDAGAGKSTLAAALVARGHRLLADDLSRVESEGEGPTLYPSSGRLKLWRDAIEHLGLRDSVIQRDHFRDDKYHLVTAGYAAGASPVPLGAIILPEWGEGDIERLRGGAAVRALADDAMYRKAFLETMGRMADHMVHCARIAAKVPVYRLSRPRDLGALDSTRKRIEELLAEG